MEIVENFINIVTKKKNDNDSDKISPKQSIIFDGIPRNQHQSDTFVALLDKCGCEYSGLYFELSRDVAEKRLLTRRICKNCKTIYPAMYTNTTCEKCTGELITRADDNADAIKTRIDIFYNETLPVIEGWRAKNKMISINADQSIDEVTEEMMKKIN